MPKATFQTRLTDYLDASYALLLVETHEESRVIEEVRAVVRSRTYNGENNKTSNVRYAEWDSRSGLIELSLVDPKKDPEAIKDTQDPLKMLPTILSRFDNPAVIVVKDIHFFLTSGSREPVIRWFRNLAGRIRERGVTIIMVSPFLQVPTELEKEVQLIDYRLPNKDELGVAFAEHVSTNITSRDKFKRLKLTDEERNNVAEASMGMTSTEADNAFAMATVASSRRNNDKTITFDRLFVQDVFEEKIRKLKNSALEYKPTLAGFESVGGLDIVKSWAMKRRMGFDDAARALNLPFPKGVLLAGIKGCGKTTVAQAIAFQFKFPLFVLDMGKLFASKVGESEALTRGVIRLMESIGPSVVLIDELEKSLGSNATSGGGDSGTSSRMFGTFISWLSMKTCPTFIIGTLNNFEILPSELIRKGRFDEVFWVDLPTDSERVAIFNALLEYRFKVKDFRVELDSPLIPKTRDFSGAEIESVIEEALYAKLTGEKGDWEKLLLISADNIKPQAQLDPDAITRLRDKAKAFKPASSQETDNVALLSGSKRRRMDGVGASSKS